MALSLHQQEMNHYFPGKEPEETTTIINYDPNTGEIQPILTNVSEAQTLYEVHSSQVQVPSEMFITGENTIITYQEESDETKEDNIEAIITPLADNSEVVNRVSPLNTIHVVSNNARPSTNVIKARLMEPYIANHLNKSVSTKTEVKNSQDFIITSATNRDNLVNQYSDIEGKQLLVNSSNIGFSVVEGNYENKDTETDSELYRNSDIGDPGEVSDEMPSPTRTYEFLQKQTLSCAICDKSFKSSADLRSHQIKLKHFSGFNDSGDEDDESNIYNSDLLGISMNV